MLRIVLVTLLTFLTGMTPLSAQSTDKGSLGPLGEMRARREAQRAAGKWRDDLQRVGELLAEEKWKRARRRAEGLCEEMSERVIVGFDVHLGACVALRAVARMGTGDEDEARWDWELAQEIWHELDPDFLSGFGEVGAHLRTAGDETGEEAGFPTFGVDEPPVLVKEVEPKYPYGANIGGHEDAPIVAATIGVDGRPRNPRIVKASPVVMLTYRALEALRQWRFEPARDEGKAVPVFYTLTVNYRLER